MNFLSPAFLWFIPAIAIPLALHFLFKKKPIRLPFSYVSLIKQADRNKMRRKRLNEWLLLLTRCLLVLFLALFFSRPVLFSGAAGERGDDALSLVLLVDVSASMGSSNSGQLTLNLAKREAEALLSRLGTDAQLGLLTFAEGVELEIGLGSEKAKILTALNDLKPLSKPTNLLPALEMAYAMLANRKKGKAGLVIFSDQFKTGWSSAIDAQGRFNNFDPEVRVLAWETVGAFSNRSIGSADMGLSQEGQLRGQWSFLYSGDRPGTPQWRFELNGKTVQTGKLSAQGNQGRESISIESGLTERGSFHGSISLDPDPLPFDDRYYVAGRFPKGYSLVVVDGEPGSAPSDSEAYFFRSALESPVDPRVKTARYVTEAEFSSDLLREADVLALANVTSLEDVQTDILDWVEKGGKVLLTAGSAWREGPSSPLGLFSKAKKVNRTESFEAPDPENPVLRGLSGMKEFQWSDIRTSSYLKLESEKSDRVILRLKNGDPILTRRYWGQGEVFLLGTTLDRSWSNLCSKPVFSPLMRELSAYLGGSSSGESNLTFFTGENFRIAAPPGVTRATVIYPNESSQGVRTNRDGAFEFSNLNEPGLYRVATGQPEKDFYFALNVKGMEAEGQVEKINEKDLKEAFPQASVHFIARDDQALAAALSILQGKNLTDIFLAGLFLLFGVETVLGWRRKS